MFLYDILYNLIYHIWYFKTCCTIIHSYDRTGEHSPDPKYYSQAKHRSCMMSKVGMTVIGSMVMGRATK